MRRQIVFDPAGLRDLQKLDRQIQRQVTAALDRLAESEAGDVKALHGPLSGTYRLRVRAWRVHFRYVPPATIRVLLIEKRGDAYRD